MRECTRRGDEETRGATRDDTATLKAPKCVCNLRERVGLGVFGGAGAGTWLAKSSSLDGKSMP